MEETRQAVRQRDGAFLDCLRRLVFENPGSPYLPLLRHAGAELGDIDALVRSDGLEGTLRRLAIAGVYVTHDEMKGRTPARRGSVTFQFQDRDFDNPLKQSQLSFTTSGSTGNPTAVGIHFDHYRAQLLQTRASVAIHDLTGAAAAVWLPLSEWSISRMLRLWRAGVLPRRWFTQVQLAPPSATWECFQVVTGFVAGANLLGVRIPRPRHVPVDQPGPLVEWIAKQRKQDRRVLLITYPSSAARACVWAVQHGVSLEGTVLLVAGETVTSARRQSIEAAGAICLPLFGCTETGESGEGCLDPKSADDMHLYSNKFALVTHGRLLEAGQEVEAMLFTALSLAAPKVFFNGETGDAACVEERDCECPWGQAGFRTHFKDVWSFSKLTIEGTTVPGTDVFEVLEIELPRRFGGRAGDYQLVAEPGESGVTRYRLGVSPALPGIDAAAVREGFLAALVERNASSRLLTDFLRAADQIRVVRQEAVAQRGGKSLPVMLNRR